MIFFLFMHYDEKLFNYMCSNLMVSWEEEMGEELRWTLFNICQCSFLSGQRGRCGVGDGEHSEEV